MNLKDLATTAVGTYHLADDRNGLYEVQRANNFELLVHFDSSDAILTKAGLDNETVIQNAYAQEVLRLSVNNVTPPSFEQSVIDIPRGNSTFHAAGKPTFTSGSFSFNDYVGADVVSILLAWQSMSYDVVNETVGQMKDYKRDCDLVQYTSDYSKIVRIWHLKGVWLSQVKTADLDMTGGDDKVMVDANFVYDRAIPETSITTEQI